VHGHLFGGPSRFRGGGSETRPLRIIGESERYKVVVLKFAQVGATGGDKPLIVGNAGANVARVAPGEAVFNHVAARCLELGSGVGGVHVNS
jgi:hypothetical protein